MNIGITWGALDRLIWSPILVVVAILLIYRLYKTKMVVRLLAVLQHESRLLLGFSQKKMKLKALLFFLGSVALFLVVLEPQWNKKEHVVAQEGRDLFIALDISRSMLVQDCKPDRLSCAKEKIKSLIKYLSCERIGLILFSGSTFVQCPLTADYGAFEMFLNQIDVETISSGTTALDAAIKKAIAAFQTTPDQKNRLLVVFTDGEDFSSNLAGVKQQAAQVGMHIFTIGVGTTQGAPIPLFDVRGNHMGHQRNQKGGVVISRLNEDILRALSLDSGGIYIKMTDDDSDVRSLISHVNRFEKEKFDDKKIALFEQQYPYFIAGSFGFFLMEWFL
ncbi:MAG TPA: VWA domain-containing protein [Candidatus Babeliales bacterium]|nr:VWA domain-containing protein [Candidatus Babeliales bacterium]